MSERRDEAEAMFAALAASDEQPSVEEFWEQRFTDAFTTLFTTAYVDLENQYGSPEAWPSWPQAMIVLDLDEIFDLLTDWVEQKLQCAGLIPADAERSNESEGSNRARVAA